MTIRSSIHFKYNGRTSSEMGLYNVNVGSNGLLEEAFLPTRTIRQETIRGNPVPYFMGFDYEPLVIPLSFAFVDYFDSAKIREVARWLSPDFYKELSFSDNWGRIFYAMPVEDSSLIHNGLKQGYLEINMQCNSPFAYTPVVQTIVYDYSNNPSDGTTYVFENVGDLEIKPKMIVQIVSGSSFSITNTSNGGKKFGMSGLKAGETITIDFDLETIESDYAADTRYENVDRGSEFFSMVYGNNYLNIKGKVKIQWIYQCILLQG